MRTVRWRIAAILSAAIAISYGLVFSIVGTFHVIAFMVILLTVRRVEPVVMRVRSVVV